MKTISSLSHPLVKHLVKLREERAYRYKEKKILITGRKLVFEMARKNVLKTLLVEKEMKESFLPSAEQTYFVSFEVMKKITALSHPQAFAAEIPLPLFSDLKGKQYILILDGISDPGNLGTLLRTALALNWEGVFITEDSADPFNDKALRAAQGSTFVLPLQVGSEEELKKIFQIQEMTYYAADIRGESLETFAPKSPVALILGNESRGPSVLAKEKSKTLSIPMNEKVDSLNVAIAGAILMFYLRQA